MPLKPHPTDPDKMVYASRQYDMPDETFEAIVAGAKANGSWDKKYPNFGPQPNMHYGMNQDDWKDIVAAISKARDSRGIHLACRPADVFQDWFLAMGVFKPKEKETHDTRPT